MYIFSRSTKLQQAFLEETSCGSVCINDVIMQFTGETAKRSSSDAHILVFMEHSTLTHLLVSDFSPLLDYFFHTLYTDRHHALVAVFH